MNCTLAGLECHFHKVTLRKSLRQDQESPCGREYVQLGSNQRTLSGTDCYDNRAAYFHATRSLGRIGLGKVRHGCRLSHPGPVATRLPMGVDHRVADVLLHSVGLRHGCVPKVIGR